MAPLANLFAGRTVVGLGDGPGNYRKLILETGKVQKYDAYDGAPYINNITNGQVVYHPPMMGLTKRLKCIVIQGFELKQKINNNTRTAVLVVCSRES